MSAFWLFALLIPVMVIIAIVLHFAKTSAHKHRSQENMQKLLEETNKIASQNKEEK